MIEASCLLGEHSLSSSSVSLSQSLGVFRPRYVHDGLPAHDSNKFRRIAHSLGKRRGAAARQTVIKCHMRLF